jgi:hypothetical protein
MAADETVEFGEDERPARLIDRLLGDPATRTASRISLPAVASAAIAFGLFAVAETVPWVSVKSATLVGSVQPALTDREASIEVLGGAAPGGYYIALILLLMVLGAAMVSRPHLRRLLTAAGFGLCAAMLVVILGLIGKAGGGGDLQLVYNVDASAGTGAYVAIAAVVAAAVALALTGWRPQPSIGRRKRMDIDDDDDEVDSDTGPGPIDLTVTSA